jgi:hypothetical protein
MTLVTDTFADVVGEFKRLEKIGRVYTNPAEPTPSKPRKAKGPSGAIRTPRGGIGKPRPKF